MQETPLKFTGKYIQADGSRKRASARVRLYNGDGKYTINNVLIDQKDINKYNYYLLPLYKINKSNRFNVSITLKGGGIESQKTASCNALAKALVIFDKSLKQTLRNEGYITRDPREKERKKPGLRRARRAPQWQKR